MIKHILSDGRTIDRIDGFRIPYTQATETAYRLLAGSAKGNDRAGRNKQKTDHVAHTVAQETMPAL